MESIRGRDRGSHIQGSSVHNQRIERLHRDTTQCCLSSFYTVFDHMENNGILDLSNDTDVFCLHYAFVPRINRALEGFRPGWNHHCLRTKGNKTLYQIWKAGVIGDAYRGYTAVQDILNPDLTVYGVGRDSTDLFVNDDNETVNVLQPNCPLSEDQISILKGEIDPLSNNTNFGVDIYLWTVHCVARILGSSQSHCLKMWSSTPALHFFLEGHTRREVCVTLRISNVEIIMCVICKESCDLLSVEKKWEMMWSNSMI